MRTRAKPLLYLCVAAICAATAAAAAPVPVTFGDSRSLQDLVDHRYGRNHIDVTRDYIGARAGDIDPWFWVGDRIGAVRVRVVKRDKDLRILGWYMENSSQATLPTNGGVLFAGRPGPHEEAFFILPGARTRFGFYVDALSTGVPPGVTERFYTDRLLNDCGPDGKGAIHPPYDGDVEALVFDVSRWAGPDTWLVCFEDVDTGGVVTDGTGGENPDVGDNHGNPRKLDTEDDDDGDDPDDNRQRLGCDFDDAVFEVHADGATLARILSFGGLKLLYR
jgi:hypothetical protein